MRRVWIVVGLIWSLNLSAQTVMTVDRTEVILGDQIKATITTDLSGDREWRNIKEVWPDSIPGIEVASGPELDAKNPASTRATWLISVFDTGFVHIPALHVVIRNGNQLDTFITTDIPISVKSIEPDSSGLMPIKDIVRQPFSIGYYKKFIPHALVVLALILATYMWWRRKNRVVEVPEIIIPEPLPHEWAMSALDELENKRLWQSGEIKEHYTLLTAILREYLERRYSIHALEQTSDEIIDQLRRQNLSTTLLNDTTELLSASDLIKFAKADPGIDLHAVTIQRVRNFVQETKEIPTPVITEKPFEDEPVE
ncbi:MAG: hypothetical protein M3R25_13515 [Bacteroidota bacterium]|nr:hypothetical protein [Bacteroidota bacterium]